MKLWAGFVASAFVLAGLAGCGSDDYCEDVADAGPVITTVEDGELIEYSEVLPTLNELSDEAPDDVTDDWKTMTTFMESAQSYYDEIESLSENADDVTLDDIWDLHENKPDPEDAGVDEAGENIREHAQSSCEVDLSD